MWGSNMSKPYVRQSTARKSNRLGAVLCACSANNACFGRDEPMSKRVSGVGPSRKPPKLRSWRRTQQRDAKDAAQAAVVGEMKSLPRAAAIVHTRCWRAELGMRQADLRREAAVIIAKPASVLLYSV